MSIDRSLHIASSLVRHRNVLTRAERVALLQEQDKLGEHDRVLGLPKVPHRKAKATKKKPKAEGAAEEAAAKETT